MFKWLDSAKQNATQKLSEKEAEKKAEAAKNERQTIDQILEKVSREGIGALSEKERETLRNARKR